MVRFSPGGGRQAVETGPGYRGMPFSIAAGVVRVKGPKGQLEVGLLPGISAAVEDGELKIARSDEERQTRSAHGLLRSLLSNAAIGVSRGWSKELDIVGIGYRAESKGRSVRFNLGYSHPIDFALPEGIEVEVIDPRTLVPLDTQTILESVGRTGRLVVASEDVLACGVTAEIAAIVAERGFWGLDAPIVRVGVPVGRRRVHRPRGRAIPRPR